MSRTGVPIGVASIRSLKDELQRMIADCSRGGVAECRVIEALATHQTGITSDADK